MHLLLNWCCCLSRSTQALYDNTAHSGFAASVGLGKGMEEPTQAGKQADSHVHVMTQAWQDSRNKAKAAEEAAKEAEEAQAAKWSLEDDFEDDEEGAGGAGPSRAPRKALQEGSDEVDPLEAFMNQNAETLHAPSRVKPESMDEVQGDGAGPSMDDDEVDPWMPSWMLR